MKVNEDITKLYNISWKNAIENQHEDFGDLYLTIQFLQEIDPISIEDNMLEIGCAVGKLVNFLYEKGYRNIQGIDIAASAIEYGKSLYPHLNLQQGQAYPLNFPNETIDTCLSFDVVEHIEDIGAHFKEVHRILKKKGKYIFQTPNLFSNSVFETINSRGFQWRKYHPSLQTIWSLKRNLKKAGFERFEFHKISPVSEHKTKQLPGFLKQIFKCIPWKNLPMFMQIGFYTVAYKSE